MYYPIGWHKVLKLDTQCNEISGNIISVQANHERELYFILTDRSIHIWNPRPAVEIVCHRRSEESIRKLGFNKSAIWKTDSSVIVVATGNDQLIFYQLRRRNSSSSTNFLLPSASNNSKIYNLIHDSKSNYRLLDHDSIHKTEIQPSNNHFVPALTIFSFGKLDLSAIGISCLMSAEEEIILGSRNGNIYGVFWNGNTDSKFPWSLSKEVRKGSDFLVDIKYSSVISGFVLVFRSGRLAYMSLKTGAKTKTTSEPANSGRDSDSTRKPDVPNVSKANFFAEVKNACCVEINHRFRLVAVGLKNSNIVVCNINHTNTNLVLNHKLEPAQNKFPYETSHLGSVGCLRYSPDNFALAATWKGGEFAIWSVFGALLFSSQQWDQDSKIKSLINSSVIFPSLAWGREGYNIWLCSTQTEEMDPEEQAGSSKSNGMDSQDSGRLSTKSRIEQEVVLLSMARSSLVSSPHLTCCSDSILLMSENLLYIGSSVPHDDKFDRWTLVDIPQYYLDNNYPIRYAIVDRNCKNVAVAGNYGFALYEIDSKRWKHFRKKNHEQSFSVCGDMIWWNEYLVISCFNSDNKSFELRAYPTGNSSIETEQAVIQVTNSEIMRLSIFENRLLVLYSDGTLGMFMLNLRWRPNFRRASKSMLVKPEKKISESSQAVVNGHESEKSSRSSSIASINYSKFHGYDDNKSQFSLQISPLENLVISNLQATAYCITSVALSRLHFKNNRHDDSVLLNACGKLFLLERELPSTALEETKLSKFQTTSTADSIELNDSGLENGNSMTTNEIDYKLSSALRVPSSVHLASVSLKNTIKSSGGQANVAFKIVSVIATNVEQFWISPEISQATEMSYFKKSLWLYCGAGANGSTTGLQVWLPLLNDSTDPPTNLYVPDRIMLPIKCDIYPLAVRSSAPDVKEPDDAIVLGAENDIICRDSKLFTHFPYSTVKRQCRVYLHRILRELLLNQHLGYYAKKIAESCQSLPYFAHCFELLLHEVLEEEATSPVPLPDPMLPQVVKFIREFSVYQETVVHCARKSELTMWSYLFDERAVGSPRRLFKECLELNKLDTAASCLIILQSLDRNILSQRMVRELIKASKSNKRFEYLIEDLETFLNRAELDYTSTSTSGSGSPST